MKIKLMLLLMIVIGTMSACSSGGPEVRSEMNYEETKKMLVDILHSDEGRSAVQEIMSDDKMKEKMIIDQAVVKDTIQQTLTSKEGEDFWKKSLKDPKFAAGLGKSMSKENEALLKNLMKDPEYRAMMIEVFKEPELQKELSDALKTKEFRKHLQSVISETMESPIYKAKMQELLINGAEEMQKGKETGGKASEKE